MVAKNRIRCRHSTCQETYIHIQQYPIPNLGDVTLNNREKRAALSDDAFSELVAFEILTCSNIKEEEGILNMVRRYSLHGALRDQMRKKFEEDVE